VTPLQFFILVVASWISRRQGQAIEFLQAENRVLRARFGPRRLRCTDGERRLLAEKGKPLGWRLVAEVASLATPETILARGTGGARVGDAGCARPDDADRCNAGLLRCCYLSEVRRRAPVASSVTPRPGLRWPCRP
jgi:hypothetical protein